MQRINGHDADAGAERTDRIGKRVSHAHTFTERHARADLPPDRTA